MDPRIHAVRADLADVRLADRVFAPHYAAPLPRTLLVPSNLRAERGAAADVVATLAAGEVFEVLEVTGGTAWGVSVPSGLVGYVSAEAVGIDA